MGPANAVEEVSSIAELGQITTGERECRSEQWIASEIGDDFHPWHVLRGPPRLWCLGRPSSHRWQIQAPGPSDKPHLCCGAAIADG